jgi:hypothetical protein
LLSANRHAVLSVTHALEVHKTISGDDVKAVIECRPGPLVDGSIYGTEGMKRQLEEYHAAAVAAHHVRDSRPPALPAMPSANTDSVE